MEMSSYHRFLRQFLHLFRYFLYFPYLFLEFLRVVLSSVYFLHSAYYLISKIQLFLNYNYFQYDSYHTLTIWSSIDKSVFQRNSPVGKSSFQRSGSTYGKVELDVSPSSSILY